MKLEPFLPFSLYECLLWGDKQMTSTFLESGQENLVFVFTLFSPSQKVNAHLKRSDHELTHINATMQEIHSTSLSFAPTIRMDVAFPQRRESATPMASVPSTPEQGISVSSPNPP